MLFTKGFLARRTPAFNYAARSKMTNGYINMQSLLDLLRGVTHHPWKTFAFAFTAFSIVCTIMQGLTLFVPGIKIEGSIALGAVIIGSIAYALIKVWKPSKVEIRVANSNTIIEVIFGDLFEQDGIRIISVNNFFDTILGKPVSEKSLHGIFIQKCFGGQPESLDKQLEKCLEGIASSKTNKADGKNRAYPIGTTALITVNRELYILLALTESDPVTCKASCDVTKMWEALHALWKRTRIESGGHTVNLPLIGSGLSGLGLPTRDLLNLIVLSAITETKAKVIAQRLRIVLHRDRFEELDLRDLKRHWEEK